MSHAAAYKCLVALVLLTVGHRQTKLADPWTFCHQCRVQFQNARQVFQGTEAHSQACLHDW